MNTMKDRAVGILAWAEDDSVSKKEVAEKLAAADAEALQWKVAQLILSEEQLQKIKRLAEVMASLGFEELK